MDQGNVDRMVRRYGRDLAAAGYLLSVLFCRKGEVAGFYPRVIVDADVVEVLERMKGLVEDDSLWDWPEVSDAVLMDRIGYAHLPDDCDVELYLEIVRGSQPEAVRSSIKEVVEKCMKFMQRG